MSVGCVGFGQRGQQPLGVGQRQLGVDRRFRGRSGSRGCPAPRSGRSACRPAARSRCCVATSSIVRLNASPVGEKPNGDSSTSAPMSIARRIAAASTLRTTPLCMEVDAVDDADRPRGEEVARHHAHRRVGHRRVRQALRERGLDLEAQLAGGFLRAVERDRVGDAQAVAEARRMALGAQLLVDLRPKAVHQHELDAHRVQDRQVLHEADSACRRRSARRRSPTTKVLPRYAWMYGATERNHGTKVWGKTRLMAVAM